VKMPRNCFRGRSILVYIATDISVYNDPEAAIFVDIFNIEIPDQIISLIGILSGSIGSRYISVKIDMGIFKSITVEHINGDLYIVSVHLNGDISYVSSFGKVILPGGSPEFEGFSIIFG